MAVEAAIQRRPSIFIGSSTEGLAVAEAIQVNLDYACEVVIWSQGVFGLGQGTLESLSECINDFDFAILVLTPDDLTESREDRFQSPRDNVLLEMGMFLGAIGRNRTFAVFDRSAKLKLPSDLAGVTQASFQAHENGKMQASVGACCTQIKGVIQQLGVREKGTVSGKIDENTQFQIIHDLLDTPDEQFLILMAETEKSLPREPMFGPGLRYSFSSRTHAGDGGFSVNKLCERLPDAGLLQQDLRNNVIMTDLGRRFVQWLIDRGHKADYFDSPIGGWGTKPENWLGWGYGQTAPLPEL
jgi:Predicted nucleotide-binding protein containing TIR-like domain